jgi:hypothetical protein
MAEHSSFFNSISGDRKYKAEDFASYFNDVLTNGVFPSPSTNLQVMSNSNMTITVKAGKAFINGYAYNLDADLIMTLATADGTLNRWDRVVIRFDAVGRTINLAIKTGTVASTPVAPVLEQDASYFELGICDIYVSKGNLSILQVNMRDTRLDITLCGWVNSLIQVDGATLYAQLTASFNSWFTTLQDQLDGNVAGNLQTEITNMQGTGYANQSIMSVLNSLNALLSNPTFANNISAPYVTATTGFHGIGRQYMSHWNGTVPAGSQVTINHIVDYNPMLQFDGTEGNCLLNSSYTPGNTSQFTVYNAGTTDWRGNINMY